MIKVKIIDVLNSLEALEKISNQEVVGIQAYKIGKTLKLINNLINLYELSRKKLCELYCVKDENNNLKINSNGIVQVIPEKIEIFNQEIEKLNNLLIELNVPLLVLDDLNNFTLTPQEASSLDWWIK